MSVLPCMCPDMQDILPLQMKQLLLMRVRMPLQKDLFRQLLQATDIHVWLLQICRW